MKIELLQGDCFEVMQGLADNSVDLVLTDPPYGLKFMGKKWDYDIPSVEVWVEALRTLKPGGHLLAFSADRTYHRMACRIEDAGFEIRAMAIWAYGNGYPKSKNHLKPSIEPMVLARKKFNGTEQKNIELFGVGGLNIEECRIGGSGGRWPANLIHDGSEEVVDIFPYTKSGKAVVGTGRDGNYTCGIYGAKASKVATCYADEGSASRLFYCAKASRRERGEGNTHTTVKPIALMEYLVQLASRPGAVVLDPFMGSGTTGIACRNLGREFIGIEMNEEYMEIAKRRIGES